MALNQKYSKSDSILISEDSHIATLVSVVDIGNQLTGFQDKDGNSKAINQVQLTFEFQDSLLSDGRPAVQSQTYTASLNEKSKLLPVMQALLGGDSKARDYLTDQETNLGTALTKALGKAVLVTIEHKKRKKDNTPYANIASVSTLPKALITAVKPPVNPTLIVTDVDNIDKATLEKLPKFTQEKIAKRIKEGTDLSNTTLDDEIEF